MDMEESSRRKVRDILLGSKKNQGRLSTIALASAERFTEGLSLSINASLLLFHDAPTRKTLLVMLAVAIILALLTYVTSLLALLPLHLLSWPPFPFSLFLPSVSPLSPLLSLLPPWLSGTLSGLWGKLVTYVPYTLLLGLRFVWFEPLDRLFRRGLEICDPQLQAIVYALPTQPAVEGASEFFMRFLQRVGILTCLHVASSLVPWGSVLVQLYLTNQTLGWRASLLLAAGSLLPPFSLHPHLFSEFWLNCHSLALELLEPFVRRIAPSKTGRAELFRRHRSFLFGFVAPFALCLSFPLLGLMAFAVAQAAIAFVVAKEFEAPDSPTRSLRWQGKGAGGDLLGEQSKAKQ